MPNVAEILGQALTENAVPRDIEQPQGVGAESVRQLQQIYGRPEWSNEAIPLENRLSSFLQSHVEGGTQDSAHISPGHWAEVYHNLRQHFPSIDPNAVRQQFQQMREQNLHEQRAELARSVHSGQQETTYQYLMRRSVPFGSAIVNWAETNAYNSAGQRIASGQGTHADYNTVADFEQRQQSQQHQTFGQQLMGAAAAAPAFLGEAVLASRLLGPAGGLLPWARGAGTAAAGAGIPRVAAPLLSRAGAAAFAGRTAASTAAMPSFWLPGWAQNNLEAGREAYDVRGLPPSFAYGAIQTAVLGSLPKWGNLIGGRGVLPTAARLAAAGGAGVVEQQLADVVAGAARIHNGFGLIGHALSGRQGEAMQEATIQAITFAAFAALHGRQEAKPHPILEAQAAALRDLQRPISGRPGLSAATAAERVNLLQDAWVTFNQEKPNATRGEGQEFFNQRYGPGRLRDYGGTLAESLPATRPEVQGPPVPRGLVAEQAPTAPPAAPAAPEAQMPPQPAPKAPAAPPAPPATPREAVARLEAAHMDVLRKMQDAQRTVNAMKNEAAMGLGREKQIAQAEEAVRQHRKAMKGIEKQLGPAREAAMAAEPPAPRPVSGHPLGKLFAEVFPNAEHTQSGRLTAKIGERQVWLEHDPARNVVRVDFEGPKTAAEKLPLARGLHKLVGKLAQAGVGIEFKAIDSNRGPKIATERADLYARTLTRAGYEQIGGPGIDKGDMYLYRLKAAEPTGEKAAFIQDRMAKGLSRKGAEGMWEMLHPEAAEPVSKPIQPEAKAPAMIERDGHQYADTPHMRALLAEGDAIRQTLPSAPEGHTRLWRGHAPGESIGGKAERYTDSLEGIALPFAKGSKGKLSYVDVPTAELEKYRNQGEPSAFYLPHEITKRAKGTVPEAPGSPVREARHTVSASSEKSGQYDLKAPIGENVGKINLGVAGGENEVAARMFPSLVREGQKVARIGGIRIAEGYRGKGLGQKLYLDGFLQHGADWYYNSQSEPEATRALNTLAAKGLIELHWRNGEQGGVHLVRLTPEGRRIAQERITATVPPTGPIPSEAAPVATAGQPATPPPAPEPPAAPKMSMAERILAKKRAEAQPAEPVRGQTFASAEGMRSTEQIEFDRAGLTPREIDIITRRRSGETLEAIGTSYGVTREAIRVAEGKAQKKLDRTHSVAAEKVADFQERLLEDIDNGRVAALGELGIEKLDLAKNMMEDAVKDGTVELEIATRQFLEAAENARQAGLTPERVSKANRRGRKNARRADKVGTPESVPEGPGTPPAAEAAGERAAAPPVPGGPAPAGGGQAPAGVDIIGNALRAQGVVREKLGFHAEPQVAAIIETLDQLGVKTTGSRGFLDAQPRSGEATKPNTRVSFFGGQISEKTLKAVEDYLRTQPDLSEIEAWPDHISFNYKWGDAKFGINDAKAQSKENVIRPAEVWAEVGRIISKDMALPSGGQAPGRVSKAEQLRRNRLDSTIKESLKEAAEAGLNVNHIHQAALQELALAKPEVADHNALLEDIYRVLASHGVTKAAITRERNAGGDGSRFAGMDLIASELDGPNRQRLAQEVHRRSEQQGSQLHPSDVAWELMADGPRTVDQAEAYRKAIEIVTVTSKPEMRNEIQEALREFSPAEVTEALRSGTDHGVQDATRQVAEGESRQAEVPAEGGHELAGESAGGPADTGFDFGANAPGEPAGTTADAGGGFGRPVSEAERGPGTFGGGQENAAGGRPRSVTALANEITDKQREKDGKPALLRQARQTDPAVWDRAMARLDTDPQAAERLVDELANKPRATTAEENALLLQRRVAMSNEHTRAMLDYIKAFKEKAPAATLDALEIRERSLNGQMDKVDRVIVDTGSEWGRAGRWRRVLLAEDFSLSGLLRSAEAAKGRPLTAAERQQIAEMAAKIKDLSEKLAAFEDAGKGKTDAAKDVGFELSQIKAKFGRGLEADRDARAPWQVKAFRMAGELISFPRAIMASIDFPLLRQGMIAMVSHPIRTSRGIPEMFRSFFSEAVAARAQYEIENRPNAELYRASGLDLTSRHGALSHHEEGFVSRLLSTEPGPTMKKIEAVPGLGHVIKAGKFVVQGSERAYGTILNRIRADTFDAMAATLSRSGKLTTAEAKVIANYANVMTGRGSLGPAEKAAVLLNHVFFAPKWAVSRFQYLLGQPIYSHIGLNATRARVEVAKEYGRFVAGLGVVAGLAVLAGFNLERDPRSANFGKLIIGNTRLDLLGGLASAARLLSQTFTLTNKNQAGQLESLYAPRFGHDSIVSVYGHFLRGKLAPTPGAILNVLSGSDVVGNPMSPQQAAANLVTPLYARDVYEAMVDLGIPRGTVVSLLGLLGMGMNTYDSTKKRAPVRVR